MASKNFTQNSSGKTFEEMSNGVTDLSALAEDSLLAGSSMNGGNMITAKKTSLQMAAPGTPSEQTDTNVLGADFSANHVYDPAATPQTNDRKEVH
jgi:hypothetical protein